MSKRSRSRLPCLGIFLAALLLASRNGVASVCVPGAPPAQKPLNNPPPPACEPKNCDKCTKSPCYITAGTYLNDFLDLQIPTGGLYPLTVSRRYDSGRPADGPLGVGWSSSLTAHLYYATYIVSSPSTYTYEADVVMPSGTVYRFTTNGSSFTPPAGSFDSLVKNADGTYSLTLQHTRSVYRFNADGSLTSLTDDYGNAITYTYDASGRVQQVADAAGSGRNLTVTWGSDGHIKSMKDNANRVIKYEYGADGTLISYSDPIASADQALRTTYYSYVASRFGPVLSSIEDRWHRTVSNITWYNDGRMMSFSEGDYNYTNPSSSTGERYVYAYGPDGLSATKVDSLGSRSYYPSLSGVANDTTRTFDPSTGLVTSEILPAGNLVSYTYNARGNIATVTPGATGAPTWTYTYDSAYPDQVSAITSSQPSLWAGWRYSYYNGANGGPAGALMQVARIGTNGVISITVAAFGYDARGRLTSRSDSMGHAQVYGYNAAGDVTSASVAGNVTTYDRDTLGRIVRITTPSNNATTYTYDDDDRVKSVTLPSPATLPTLDFTTRFSYDNFDATTGWVNTVTTDPNGNATTQSYDALGHLVRAVDAMGGNAAQYSYQYNLLQSVTDANGNMTSYSYNADRHLVKTTFFDGAFETYAVNAAGGITGFTDRRGQTTSYQYDGYGRLISGPTGSYTYSGQNMTGAAGLVYTYDSLWRVATETQAGGDIITYTYGNANDVLSSYRVDPPTGQPGTSVTATFGYDSAGRLSSLVWSPVAGSFTFSYNADGQYAAVHFPNGQSRAFTYDNQGRLLTLANLDAQLHNILTFAYGYDYNWPLQSYTALGERTSMNVTGSAGVYQNGTTKYVYDADAQLTSVIYANGTTSSYAYDAIGNRTQATVNGGTTPYVYYQNALSKNTPRLRNVLGGDLTYDANGNLTTGGYTWDGINRLTAISSIQYQYDYQGRRNLYTPAPGAGSPVRYISWGMSTIAERSVDATRTNDYLFAAGVDDVLARRASDGSIKYYLSDGLGSVVAITSTNGQIASTAAYDAWGVTSGVDFFGYTGREWARPVSNLWNYRARYYRADWGRFISEDPLAQYLRVTGSAAYTYVFSSPVMSTDPTGLECKDVVHFGPKAKIGDLEMIQRWIPLGADQSLQAGAGGPPNTSPGGANVPANGKGIGGSIPGVITQTCMWRDALQFTQHWHQKSWVERTCTCPDAHYIWGAMDKKWGDSWMYPGTFVTSTVGHWTLGFPPHPCEPPS